MEGSGYFLVNSSEGGIVNMKYREAESAIEVIVVEMLCAREAWVENFKGRFILWKKEEITFFFFFFSFPFLCLSHCCSWSWLHIFRFCVPGHFILSNYVIQTKYLLQRALT